MAETASILDAKIANALSATRLFVRELESENLRGWVEHFESITSALEAGDAKKAVQLYQSKKDNTGPGSLSDVFGSKLFEKRWGQCSSTIGNIRLYLEYGMDRPLVSLACE